MVAFDIDMLEEQPNHPASASDKLNAIADAVSKCRKCPLAETRTNTVPGEGSPTAEIMFVGEGPGRDEDLSGRPFVGRAGKFLDELIQSLPMRREDVFIANVVKCRPPGNRDPERAEVEQCSGYLTQQIETIDPLVIVPLGRHALGWFNPNLRITASNGKIFQHEDRVIMPLLHPSSGLRNPAHAEMLREGIHNIRDAILEGIRVRKTTNAQPDPIHAEQTQLEQAPQPSADARDTIVPPETTGDPDEESVKLFERPQSHEEARKEMRRLRAMEEAEDAADRELVPIVADERQTSFL